MEGAARFACGENPRVATWAEQRRERREVHQLRCAQCGYLSGLLAVGWRGYRTDGPERDEHPAVAFFCPTCSAREFGAD